jgi:dihydrofolate synthase/folylpolyglutamate synthase
MDAAREEDVAAFRRLERHLALLTDYEREARVRYDRQSFDLARMDRLCERLGRPERAFRVAHVTGTKGKGSTSAMIASAFAAAGRRVGLYTSPHLVRLGERVAVAGKPAEDADLGRAFAAIEPAIEAMRAEGERFTFFEVTTALAFERFRAERVEVAAIEVGLGGRLDSTNVVRPAACAITSVGLDHTDKLGTTLAAIAREKAGIAKPLVPLICGRLAPEAEQAVREVARAAGAPVLAAPADLGAEAIVVSETATRADLRTPWRRIEGVELGLLGRHMAENAAVAASAVLAMEPSLPDDVLRAGLRDARIRARFEIFRGSPTVVVDGAHNPDSIAALARALEDVFPGARPVAVMGAMRDKDVAGMLAAVARFAAALVAAPCGSARETPPEDLRRMAEAAGLAAETAPAAAPALERARALAGPGGLVVVCGSLYLAGSALSALDAARGASA